MIEGPEVVAGLKASGFSHVVWIPDSHLGRWESTFLSTPELPLVRACREGEAVAIAAGLMLGGASPLVIIQCTGFFEAGDAVRNVAHDMRLPLKMLVGVRSHQAHLQGKSKDNCPKFTEPVVDAWGLPRQWFDPFQHSPQDLKRSLEWLRASDDARVLLWSE